MGIGAPPRGGWAMGMTEMMVTDYPQSLAFWTKVLGCEMATGRRDPWSGPSAGASWCSFT